MNLLNSRLSKGQVKYRLRKKLPRRGMCCQVYRGSGTSWKWVRVTGTSVSFLSQGLLVLPAPACLYRSQEPQWTLVIYYSCILTSHLYPVLSPSLTLVYLWLVPKVIWLLSGYLGFPWLRGLHLHCLPRDQWQEGIQVLFISTHFPTQDLTCF